MGASFCYQCMAKLERETSVCPKCKHPIPYIPTDTKDITPGTLLHARYVMGRSIGRGGFGATYKAYDLLQRKVCAIKEFFPDKLCKRAPDRVNVISLPETDYWYKTYKRNFIEEARRLFDLAANPGVVKVIEQFEANGTAYFAMEFITGQTLKEYMRANPRGLNPGEALRIIAQVLQALAKVHAAGVLHRDISADNIMRTEHGRVKLIDFGSARDAQQSAKTVFTKGVYTAPEQKLGDKQRSCTDIYAVGVTMFLLLVGRVPTMTGAHLEPLRAAKKGLNEETYRVFENATALNPNYRYQKAEDMLADLERARHTLPRKLKSTKRRNAAADVGDGRKNKMRKIKGVLMIFCLLLLLLVFLIFIFGSL